MGCHLFCQVANRGYLFEQEWAWGWGFTRLIALCTSGEDRRVYHSRTILITTAIRSRRCTSIWRLGRACCNFIAHFAHLLSVLVLFKLTSTIFLASTRIALVAASLHIISPAGLFLSAPYARKFMCAWPLPAFLLFANILAQGHPPLLVRIFLSFYQESFSVLPRLFEAMEFSTVFSYLKKHFEILFLLRNGIRLSAIRRLLATGLGGICVAAGFLLPQHIAYSEYCGNLEAPNSRPWCQKSLPSVYTFVQDHYGMHLVHEFMFNL